MISIAGGEDSSSDALSFYNKIQFIDTQWHTVTQLLFYGDEDWGHLPYRAMVTPLR